MKIGIIREGKNPPDKRVPLVPRQCKALLEKYADLELVVQPSTIRIFNDKEYVQQGVKLQEDVSDCDVLLGVKEVPKDQLIAGKTYLFFSHTYKKQPYNRDLLQTILEKKIRLIDYEMLKEQGGKRLIGFGRYAGIVGAYNAFRAYGKMHNTFDLKAAHECFDRKELESELIKVNVPQNLKVVITGRGRVALGCIEILSALRLTQVFHEEFLEEVHHEPVFTQLDVKHYFKRKDGKDFTRHDFYTEPEAFESNFMPYAKQADIYIPCHFWSDKSPIIFTREDAKKEAFNIHLVSDISCDIDGPVASTLRPSTIENPYYGYHPETESEVEFGKENSIGVSAVDNLPCALPRDASEDFGNEFIKNIMPHFFNGDENGVLERASETGKEGQLTSHFSYLQDYVNGK